MQEYKTEGAQRGTEWHTEGGVTDAQINKVMTMLEMHSGRCAAPERWLIMENEGHLGRAPKPPKGVAWKDRI